MRKLSKNTLVLRDEKIHLLNRDLLISKDKHRKSRPGVYAPSLILKHTFMFYALRAGLTLAIVLAVLQMFFGKVIAALMDLILKLIEVATFMVDHALQNLPQ